MNYKSFKLATTLMLIVSLVHISGCATIVSKSSYRLTVNSTPSGAKITINDDDGLEVYSGMTPAIFELDAGAGYFAKAGYTFTLEMDGYEKRTLPVHFKLDGWYFGNIIFGGLIGLLIVDPATGAMWKIKRGYYNETLSKKAESGSKSSLNIMEYDDIPESWKANLERIN